MEKERKQMFNLLLIGKSGSGKSSICKLLTGDNNIEVGAGMDQITTEVQFFQGHLNDLVGFRVFDIPGVDNLVNRTKILKQLYTMLSQKKLELHAILYVQNITARNTVNPQLVFKLVQQLPWGFQRKRNFLIPIWTHYDLLITQNAKSQKMIKEKLKLFFDEYNYNTAWKKRIYWTNNTDDIEGLSIKLQKNRELKFFYKNQVNQLILMIQMEKVPLKIQIMQANLKQQSQFVLQQVCNLLKDNERTYCKRQKQKLSLKIKRYIKSNSSFFIIKNVINTSLICFCVFAFQTGIPLLMFIKLYYQQKNREIKGKKQRIDNQNQKLQQICKEFQKMCNNLEKFAKQELKRLIDDDFQFNFEGDQIYCRIPIKNYTFFQTENIKIYLSDIDKQFKKIQSENENIYSITYPMSQNSQPTITFEYSVKIFKMQQLLSLMEEAKRKFYFEK